jgi:hypothetical protein
MKNKKCRNGRRVQGFARMCAPEWKMKTVKTVTECEARNE